jgi:regulator of replication initiation timing
MNLDILMIAALKEQLNTLEQENERLRRERDWARAILKKCLPVATEQEEQAFIREVQTAGPGGQLAALIAELETEHGG